MAVLAFVVGIIGICWITYAVLPESRKDWALIPVAATIVLTVLSVVIMEALMQWVLLSAITGRPVECAIWIIFAHAIVAVAIWRSW